MSVDSVVVGTQASGDSHTVCRNAKTTVIVPRRQRYWDWNVDGTPDWIRCWLHSRRATCVSSSAMGRRVDPPRTAVAAAAAAVLRSTAGMATSRGLHVVGIGLLLIHVALDSGDTDSWVGKLA